MFKKLYILIIILSFNTNCFSQEKHFESLNLEHGLSQISVTCLSQDSRGAMWIGTRDGLNVYDAYSIRIFKNNKKNKNSLISNNIKDLKMMDNDNLLVLSTRGVSLIKIAKDSIYNYKNSKLNCLEIVDKNIYVATDSGLSKLDITTKKFISLTDIYPYKIKVNYIYYSSKGKLYISTKKRGLDAYNFKTKQLTHINNNSVNYICETNDGTLWLGTPEKGVFRTKDDKIINHYTKKDGLSNNTIRTICEDNDGNIWVGSFYGANIINPKTNKIVQYYHSTTNKYSLSHNSIYSMFKDREGSIWIGTYFGGLSIYNDKANIFKYYTSSGKNKSINYRVVGAMCEDNKNNLWIGTEGGGLNYFDREKNTFKYITTGKDNKHLSHNNIKSLYIDKKENKLWIGTHRGGLNIMNLSNYNITKLSNNTKDTINFFSKTISDIIQYNNNVLLATNNGVIIYNRKDNTFNNLFTSQKQRNKIGNKILSILIDNNNKLWIGSEKKGLSKYDFETKEIINYKYEEKADNGLYSNSISQIYQDHMSRIWIGSYGGGLCRYMPETDNFKHYQTSNDSKYSEFINGIIESRYGYLWIATSRNLCRLDIENEKFKNYNFQTGFPLYEINEGGLYACMDGQVFIGGIRGMVSFQEEDLNRKKTKHKVYLTDINVNNEHVNSNISPNILKTNISFTKEIHLNHKQNTLHLSYSSFNFLKTNKTKYEYKLVGFEKNWVQANFRNDVSYTNLNPGKYTFLLKEKGKDALIQSINIFVSPVFYATWWAYIIYLFLFITILIFIYKFLISKTILRQELLAEKRNKDKLDKINKSKLNFFTNISHEFRTPLTLVMGSLENLVYETEIDDKIKNKVKLAYNNSLRLKKLIDELLEFRKYDQNFIKLKISEYDIVKFSKDIFESFSLYASEKDISTNFVCRQSDINAWIDGPEMEKVLFNLLSNALKFTSHKGSVNLFVEQKDDSIHIKIIDSGKGFTEEEKNKIFDYFYQGTSEKTENLEQNGSGIGLALSKSIIKLHGGRIEVDSKPGEGSCFEIIIPKGKQHFSSKQIISENNYELNFNKKEFCNISEEKEDNVDLHEENENQDLILLVEDNVDVRKMLKNAFENKYNIIEASNGEEGYKMAIEYMPKLIISDVMMPIMSGTEMCKLIKSDIQTSHIPIVLLTAKASLEQELYGLNNGADDYITKPFNISLLAARIKNILDSRKLFHTKLKSDPELGYSNISKSKIDVELINKAKIIIEENIDNSKFDVNTFAKEMCMGRTSLYSKIKGITGQTPNDFILTIRLKKAASMFRSDLKHSVTDVAYAVGFSTPRYFSKCFSDQFGVPPSKYAKGEREKPKE